MQTLPSSESTDRNLSNATNFSTDELLAYFSERVNKIVRRRSMLNILRQVLYKTNPFRIHRNCKIPK